MTDATSGSVPELPEVESARAVIERAALNRPIVDVDDHDSYVCRPHSPGQLRDALLGRRLTAAHRQGKSMWCDTSAVGRARGVSGPTLGIHLGMSGKIVIADPDGSEIDGGDYWDRGRSTGDHRWSRFSLTFADGGSLMLVDPRRLGRIRLDPVLTSLGPDAATITPDQFRAAMTIGTAPVKARLLDQHAIAGIGNLLADEILWLARVNPARPVYELSRPDLDRLLRATRRAVGAATANGGVHTLKLIPYRKAGAVCPRDGAPMVRSTVGGRTSWWCEREQPV
jgi:formamidopyrimidine-DNA glycosylase